MLYFFNRLYRLTVRTRPSQGWNRGSIPRRVTTVLVWVNNFGWYNINMKKVFVFIFLVVSILLAGQSQKVLAASVCTNLTKDLSLGSTNSGTGSQVSLLQNFLIVQGYLATTATGRFGSLTLAAVKKFQSAQYISPTGTVGPLTRAAIQKASCTVALTVGSGHTSVSSTQITQALTASVISTLPTYLISSPSSGTQLTIGQTYPIQWSGGDSQTSVSVYLKDDNGASAGHVVSNLSGTTHNYNWTVGNVSLAGIQDVVLPPGNYQLNIMDDATYGSAFNIKSAIFSIVEVPLFISHILPSQVPNNSKSTVILYGSGFNSLTKINIVGSYLNRVIVPQYISPDGTLIWFYVPQYIPPDQYQISVFNDYSSVDTSATSSPSNSVNLQVTQATA